MSRLPRPANGRTRRHSPCVVDVDDGYATADAGGSPGSASAAAREHGGLQGSASGRFEPYPACEAPVQAGTAGLRGCPGFPAASIGEAEQTRGIAPQLLAAATRECRSSLSTHGVLP